jgi:hypothetical protein
MTFQTVSLNGVEIGMVIVQLIILHMIILHFGLVLLVHLVKHLIQKIQHVLILIHGGKVNI